jgi:hypothetical protein
MRRNQSAVANMLCYSATIDLYQFLNCSSSKNVAYIMVPDSPITTEIITPTFMMGAQIQVNKKYHDEKT